MTREEAIREREILKEDYWDDDGYGHETKQYDDTMLALGMSIQALEQQSCDDAISREDTLKAIIEQLGIRNEDYLIPAEATLYKVVKNMPPVNPQPKTGHWIKIVVNRQHKLRCNKCDYVEPEYATYIRNFCPNCGAKMVDPQESEDNNGNG